MVESLVLPGQVRHELIRSLCRLVNATQLPLQVRCSHAEAHMQSTCMHVAGAQWKCLRMYVHCKLLVDAAGWPDGRQ